MDDHSDNHNGIARAQAILLLLFLTFLNMLNFVDRALLGNLAKQVHEDLQISYEMIGLLTGFGFVLFYTLHGGPPRDRGRPLESSTVDGLSDWRCGAC